MAPPSGRPGGGILLHPHMASDLPVQSLSTSAPPTLSLWNNPAFRAIVYQVFAIAAVVLVAAYLVNNTMVNLEQRQIRSGFEFLGLEAGFAIGESVISYSAGETYAKAFLVGLLNTLKVGILAIVFATIFGSIIGVARLSSNWLIARLASIYVETIRNIPLLLQLFFWYSVLTGMLPTANEAFNLLPGVYLSNIGVNYAVPVPHAIHPYIFAAFLMGCGASYVWVRWARRRQNMTGRPVARFWPSLAFILGLPSLVFLFGGMPSAMDVPQWQRFGFSGGQQITPEFIALLLGLTTYTAGFIAETVRGGIESVPYGQTEAARSLGLRGGLVLRLVIVPQALRVIIPPLTSQYMNVIKNSSLAVAIGYPDIVSIANTSLNQTGQAIEAVLVIMSVYLTVSLIISAFMNWYNRRIALVER